MNSSLGINERPVCSTFHSNIVDDPLHGPYPSACGHRDPKRTQNQATAGQSQAPGETVLNHLLTHGAAHWRLSNYGPVLI